MPRKKNAPTSIKTRYGVIKFVKEEVRATSIRPFLGKWDPETFEPIEYTNGKKVNLNAP